MKHGPIALIDQFMPVVVIAPRSDPNYQKLQSNIEEVRVRTSRIQTSIAPPSIHARCSQVLARGGSVVVITEEDNHDLDGSCECIIRVPNTDDFTMPLLTVVPLQARRAQPCAPQNACARTHTLNHALTHSPPLISCWRTTSLTCASVTSTSRETSPSRSP